MIFCICPSFSCTRILHLPPQLLITIDGIIRSCDISFLSDPFCLQILQSTETSCFFRFYARESIRFINIDFSGLSIYHIFSLCTGSVVNPDIIVSIFSDLCTVPELISLFITICSYRFFCLFLCQCIINRKLDLLSNLGRYAKIQCFSIPENRLCSAGTAFPASSFYCICMIYDPELSIMRLCKRAVSRSVSAFCFRKDRTRIFGPAFRISVLYQN